MTAGKALPFFHDELAAFKIQYIVFSVVIFNCQLEDCSEAIGSTNWALLALGTAEAIAVCLFVFPRSTRISGKALMAIFLLAIVLSLVTGVIMSQLHLIVYLVCTYFIVVHENASQGDFVRNE